MNIFNRKLSLPASVLFEMESKLNSPTFHGVPVGSTLGDIFTIKFLNANYTWSIINIVLEVLRCIKHYLYGIQSSIKSNLCKHSQGKNIFTWIAAKNTLNGLVFPVIEQVGPDNCLVLGSTAEMKDNLPLTVEYVSWNDAPCINMSQWRNDFGTVWKIWLKEMFYLFKLRQIPIYVIPMLIDAMMVQSQRIFSCEKLLDELKPVIVITDYDRNLFTSCLVLVAKLKGIPTMTMLHGVINPPYGYTPILADYLFCWGNSQKNQLVKMGANQDTIIITGAQHICPTILADKKSSREKLFVTSDHTIVLLATNPVSKDNRKKLVKSFCESLYENSKIEMAIRLHPSEKLDFYHEEIDRFPRVRFLTNKELSLDESLAASDIVVCHDSGFGLDAIIKGKTVIILDVLDTPLKFGKELVELAGCPRARSKDELAMLIKKLISDESYLNSIRLDVEKYLRENFSVFGIDAATNVAREINNITVNHQALSLG